MCTLEKGMNNCGGWLLLLTCYDVSSFITFEMWLHAREPLLNFNALAELGAYAQAANESWKPAGTQRLISITGWQWCDGIGGNESCAAFESLQHESIIPQGQSATAKTVKMVCIPRVLKSCGTSVNIYVHRSNSYGASGAVQ